MHVNQQAREAAKTRVLSTSITEAHTSWAANFLDGQLPVAVIETSTDEVQNATKGLDETERRTVTLMVTLALDAADPLDLHDEADDLRAEIEAALADDLGGLAKRMEHTGGELEMMSDEDGEHWFAFYALSWMVELWTVRGEPEEAL